MSPDRSEIDTALARAVGFLAARQLPTGELPAWRSEDRDLGRDPAFESSPYATTYALYALDLLDDPRARAVAERARGFLAGEMEPPGLWRYYSSHNAKALPPDLDDTACAAFALRHCSEEVQLGLNLRVLLANRDAEGRFRTFLTAGPNNVDAAVNANVLLYLGERQETRAAVAWLCGLVERGEEAGASLYWVDALPFYYLLARAFHHGVAGLGACRAPAIRRIAARRRDDGSFGDELATALAVAGLLQLAAPHDGLAAAVGALLARQREDGSWPRAAFYIDFAGGFYGSEELTTAFALEALARWRQR